jgi:hypothetical protein
MTRAPLQSSVITSAGYHDGVLEVQLANGRVYRYQAERELYDGLLASDSPGRYFGRHIRPLASERVDEPKPTTEDSAA